MRLVLTKVEAKIFHAYMKGQKVSHVREYIVLMDIIARLERGIENEL